MSRKPLLRLERFACGSTPPTVLYNYSYFYCYKCTKRTSKNVRALLLKIVLVYCIMLLMSVLFFGFFCTILINEVFYYVKGTEGSYL